MDEQNKTEFVRIEITERQFITTKKDSNDPLYVSKNGVQFGKVLCPEGGTLWYPVKNMFVYDNKTKQASDGTNLKVYHFDQPSGTEFEIHYSNGIGKEDTVKTVTIDDLKEIFDQAKKDFAKANSTFVNMSVPSSWDRTPDDPAYARVSIPVEKDGEKKYYTFLLNRDKNWHESEKQEGYHYFGFPRIKQDTGEPWMINLRGDVKNEDGTYDHPEISISSEELKGYVDAAVKASVTSHLSDSHSLASEVTDGFVKTEGDSPFEGTAEKESAGKSQEAAAQDTDVSYRYHRGR